MVKPDISTTIIVSSLSDFLLMHFPESTIYSSPVQQDVKIPAWFISFIPNGLVKQEIGNRYMRTFYMDLSYLLDYNIANIYDMYMVAAETLDVNLELFKTSDGAGLLHVHDRKWFIDRSGLHYRIKIKFRASIDDGQQRVIMEQMEQLNETVIE